MTRISDQEQRAKFQLAREEFLFANPKPTELDFPCKTKICFAGIGEPCRTNGVPREGWFHTNRIDKMIKAMNLRERDASKYADDKFP